MKKFKFLVGAVALFALVVANVWNAATLKTASTLNVEDIENVEAMGQEPEYGFTINNNGSVYVWINGHKYSKTYKFDTYSASIKCTWKRKVSGKVWERKTETFDIDKCVGGWGNCLFSDSDDCKAWIPSDAELISQEVSPRS